MLRIKKVRKYRVARYPRGIWHSKKKPFPVGAIKQGTASALILALLEGCDGCGAVGPPPLPPELVTEAEAREVINRVFADNNVDLTADTEIKFERTPNDTVVLNLDGYNDSLRVGYEYIHEQDYDTFVPPTVAALERAADSTGPYVKTASDYDIVVGGDYETYLEDLMQQFIDTLRAQGVL